MTNYEMVEMLRTKANVSYEEAKTALEAANWDLLDAMVLLEQQGKVSDSGPAYTTAPAKDSEEDKAKKHASSQSEFKSGMRRFFCWLRKIIGIGNVNFFVVERKGEEIISLPVTVCVVLLPFTFWLVFWLLIVGLFTRFKYSFRGPNLGKDSINDTISKASEMADNFKADIIHNEDKTETEE